jgi:mannitol-1-phosphate/altronate dehydrogenase
MGPVGLEWGGGLGGVGRR